jgi:predicted ATPase
MANFVIISGCSGGGKSTLLEALRQRGEIVVEEPGRRIVVEEIAKGGTALPWVDPVAFLNRAVEMSLRDMKAAAHHDRPVFFDRGLVDAIVPLLHLGGQPDPAALQNISRFHRQVFIAPPWPEIYQTDAERRHGFDEALVEFERMQLAYPQLGYELLLLPKVSVAERVNFVLSVLSEA